MLTQADSSAMLIVTSTSIEITSLLIRLLLIHILHIYTNQVNNNTGHFVIITIIRLLYVSMRKLNCSTIISLCSMMHGLNSKYNHNIVVQTIILTLHKLILTRALNERNTLTSQNKSYSNMHYTNLQLWNLFSQRSLFHHLFYLIVYMNLCSCSRAQLQVCQCGAWLHYCLDQLIEMYQSDQADGVRNTIDILTEYCDWHLTLYRAIYALKSTDICCIDCCICHMKLQQCCWQLIVGM